MRREEETQAALDRALEENRRLRAEVEQLRDALAGHSAPAPESASNDSGACASVGPEAKRPPREAFSSNSSPKSETVDNFVAAKSTQLQQSSTTFNKPAPSA